MKEQFRIYERRVKAFGQPLSQEALKVIEEGKVICKSKQKPHVITIWFLRLRLKIDVLICGWGGALHFRRAMSVQECASVAH